MIDEHITTVEKRDDPRLGLFPGLHQWRAMCSVCGPVGHWQKYEPNARADANRHTREHDPV